MYPPGRTKGYIEFQGVHESGDMEGLPKLTIRNTNDTFKLPVNFSCIQYYWKKGETIFHIRTSKLKEMKNKTNITSKNGLDFVGYFATNSFMMDEYPNFYPFLIDTECPYFEWGINLFHLFAQPYVYYLKLNCTSAADPRNILGNQSTDFHIMTDIALSRFGKLAIKKNIDSYPNGS